MKNWFFVMLACMFVTPCNGVFRVGGLFLNSGTISMRESDIVAGTFDNTGTLRGEESVHLACDTLRGNGLIAGPKIEIIASECEYTGTIECSGECVLKTRTPRSQLKFQFKGTGKLIIQDLVVAGG